MEQRQRQLQANRCQFRVITVTLVAHERMGAIDFQPLEVRAYLLQPGLDQGASGKRNVGILPPPYMQQLALYLGRPGERVVVLAQAQAVAVNIGGIKANSCEYVGIHGCAPIHVSRTPDGWTIAASCVAGQTTVSTQGRASGDFGSRYHVDLTTRLTPAPTPQAAEVRTAIDAKWLGACPAGKKPGDMEMNLQTNVAPQAH